MHNPSVIRKTLKHWNLQIPINPKISELCCWNMYNTAHFNPLSKTLVSVSWRCAGWPGCLKAQTWDLYPWDNKFSWKWLGSSHKRRQGTYTILNFYCFFLIHKKSISLYQFFFHFVTLGILEKLSLTSRWSWKTTHTFVVLTGEECLGKWMCHNQCAAEKTQPSLTNNIITASNAKTKHHKHFMFAIWQSSNLAEKP